MIPKGLFTQLAMIALSIGIFFTYIQPSFTEVKADQDTILRYQEERSKVSEVNVKLNELVLKSEQITPDERKALQTYVPSELDEVAVQRDLLIIAEKAEVELTKLTSGVSTDVPVPAEGAVVSGRSRLVPYDFGISFSAPYETIKDFLALVETNNYPLVLSSLSITGETNLETEGAATDDNLVADIVLTTYALEFTDEPVPEIAL